MSTRGGAVALAGAAVNGAFGFVLTVVVARAYSPAGAGALYAAIGLVTIVAAVGALGADTGLVWALPRRPRARAGRLLAAALAPSLALSAAAAAAGVAAAGPLGRLLGVDPALIRLAAAGTPLVVASTVLLAAVRAVRPVAAYVAVQSVLVPVARPVCVVAAVAAGGGLVAGLAGWLLPVAAALVCAAVLLAGPLRGTAGRPAPDERRDFWRFALPRAGSVAVDAASMWTGVLLAGALAGAAQAGVFAAAGRYALAGLLVMQGLRVAVAPVLSRLLAAGRRADAAAAYRRTTVAVVVLSWPGYVLLAVFAPALLALFGDGFAAGAAPLAVLAAAMLVNTGVGVVQSVLLMSGDSRGHLRACLLGLALQLAAAPLLIPRYGALGAALAWSLGIVAENLLAAVLARRALGEPLTTPVLRRAGAAVLAGTGAAAAAGVAAGGRGLPGLAVALGVLAVAVAAAATRPRARAALRAALRDLRPTTPAPGPAPAGPGSAPGAAEPGTAPPAVPAAAGRARPEEES